MSMLIPKDLKNWLNNITILFEKNISLQENVTNKLLNLLRDKKKQNFYLNFGEELNVDQINILNEINTLNSINILIYNFTTDLLLQENSYIILILEIKEKDNEEVIKFKPWKWFFIKNNYVKYNKNIKIDIYSLKNVEYIKFYLVDSQNNLIEDYDSCIHLAIEEK